MFSVGNNLLNTFQISIGKKYISHNTQKTGKS